MTGAQLTGPLNPVHQDTSLHRSSPRKGNLAMAAYDTTRTLANAPTGARITSLFGTMFGAVADWNDARITRKSLSRLSARELDDIGLCRGDIDMIAAKGGRV